MEYFNNTLCISHPELIPGIMSEYNLKVLRHRGRVLQMRRACPDTPALFALDSLPARYLVKVYRRYPDLKAQAESGPFADRVEPDGAALDFYRRYRFPDGRHLSTAKQEEYANNASILNAFRAVLERPDGRRHPPCARDFWRMAAGALPFVAARFPHSLPEHPRRLQEKYEAYLREGYAVFVTGMYGTRNAAKVDDDDKESLLVRLLADARNLDRVLAVNGDGTLRFMLEKKHVQPMALADRKEGDAGELARVNRFNEELERDIGTRLGHAYEKVEQLFGDHPQLDVATRLLLCDSRGRNKVHKRTSRSAPPEEDEENIFNLY